MSSKQYNWGIIGCGKISSDFSSCLKEYSRAKIVACGARKLEKSRNFADKFDIPRYAAYDNYNAVSLDPNVDIVYIGTIHPSHHKAVIHALNNGKHVLCEKPIGMNARETKEMIEAARMNNRFLMEAMWTRFFPSIRKVRQLIKDGAIGDVVSYYGDFGVAFPSSSEVPRAWLNELGGGGILDLGCYPINPLTWIFGPRMPSKITANGIVDKKFGVDVVATCSVMYEDTKQFGQISCNMIGNSFEDFLICGKKGRIKIEGPGHAPTKITLYQNGTTPETSRDIVNVSSFAYNLPKRKTIFPGSEHMIHQIMTVTKCLDEGRIECVEYQWSEMLTTMKIMDEMRRQIGVKYKQDNTIKSKL